MLIKFTLYDHPSITVQAETCQFRTSITGISGNRLILELTRLTLSFRRLSLLIQFSETGENGHIIFEQPYPVFSSDKIMIIIHMHVIIISVITCYISTTCSSIAATCRLSHKYVTFKARFCRSLFVRINSCKSQPIFSGFFSNPTCFLLNYLLPPPGIN